MVRLMYKSIFSHEKNFVLLLLPSLSEVSERGGSFAMYCRPLSRLFSIIGRLSSSCLRKPRWSSCNGNSICQWLWRKSMDMQIGECLYFFICFFLIFIFQYCYYCISVGSLGDVKNVLKGTLFNWISLAESFNLTSG